MNDLDLTGRGKAAYGAACAVCCGLPMLVILGIVSIGVAVTVGVSIASAIAVAGTAYLVAQRRLTHVSTMVRRMLAIGGAGFSGLGLWLAIESADTAPAVLSLAVAALAAAALLAVAGSKADGTTWAP